MQRLAPLVELRLEAASLIAETCSAVRGRSWARETRTGRAVPDALRWVRMLLSSSTRARLALSRFSLAVSSSFFSRSRTYVAHQRQGLGGETGQEGEGAKEAGGEVA